MKRNYINENYIIDFDVPVAIQDYIELAEKADDEDNYGGYINYIDQINVLAKNCCANGTITREMWNKLCLRYRP